MLSPVVSSARGYYAKIAANAVVAGTVSQITGGKFANGALSGAFRFMFNEWYHDLKNSIGGLALDQLPSKLGKRLFNRFWSGKGGTYKLTEREFKYLAKLSSRPDYISIAISHKSGVNYCGTIEARAIGSATMYYDEHWNAIGFFDTYDFDMRLHNYIPGIVHDRSIINEFITDVTNVSGALFGAKSFNICYGIGCEE